MSPDLAPLTLPAPAVHGQHGYNGHHGHNGQSAPSALSPQQFQALTAAPPEAQWLANLASPHTQRAYRRDIEDFMAFAGIAEPGQLLAVRRAHVIVWRDDLLRQGLAHDTVRRKLSALSSLYAELCERGAVLYNPVLGVKRPRSMTREGATPALSDAEARRLLDTPPASTLKGQRDRAILAVLLYHGLRREELCRLRVGDVQRRDGALHLRVTGKGAKVRVVPLHPEARRRIDAYLRAAGHGSDRHGALFRPLKNNATKRLDKPLNPQSVTAEIVKRYARQAGLSDASSGIGAHALRATAATNALAHGADLAQVQAWLGHADLATTRVYDKRPSRLPESPTFKVCYEGEGATPTADGDG